MKRTPMTMLPLGIPPTLAILLGASVWGVIWYPLRLLAALGVSGTLASAVTSAVGCLCVMALRYRALASLRWHWALPLLGLASGVANLGYMWGAIHGEVMRVLLLFYLTPAWTALFAHFILHERLTVAGILLALLALTGAALMLYSPAAGVPLPANLAEWAGVAGGMGFALNNVLSVKTVQVLPQMKPEMRTVVIFGGAAIFSAVAACFEPMVAPPTGLRLTWAALLSLGLGSVLAGTNLVVQAGMVRVRANRASIVMLFELVVTALTAWWLAHEAPGPREWAGGACIVLASILSGWVHRSARD